MFKKLRYILIFGFLFFGILFPQKTIEAASLNEFSNGQWEICYFSGWFIFQKETCNVFSEGNYILTNEGNTWTINVKWEQDINFRAKLVRIKQKSLLGTLKIYASNIPYTNEPIINGKRYCEYIPSETLMECSLWGNQSISIIPDENVTYTIFAQRYTNP